MAACAALVAVLASALLIAADGSADGPGVTGNCLSGTYAFNQSRMYFIPPGTLPSDAPYPPVLAAVDWSAYDFTVDYGRANINLAAPAAGPGGVGTRVAKTSKMGVRFSSTRYLLYGLVCIDIKATPASAGGMVSPFVTMSDLGDEIDWEILPAVTDGPITTNLFYKQRSLPPEYGMHDASFQLPSGGVDTEFHTYCIDWTSQRIEWSVDGTVVRTYKKNDSYEGDPINAYYYPDTPSIVQIGAWDGGDSPNKGTSDWAGGPVNWPSDVDFLETNYGPLSIQCYDDQDQPVDMWPIEGNRNETTITPTSEPPAFRSVSTTVVLQVVAPTLTSSAASQPSFTGAPDVPTGRATPGYAIDLWCAAIVVFTLLTVF
ncbi:hypothetical protein HK405_012831 [Cladochytrium tenue]|nr:hypothetical protein HK405_012831 [Cladochytrium tenue]